MAGYSGTPLAQKLGFKPGATVIVIDAPDNYQKLLGRFARDLKFTNHPARDSEFVHLFATRRAELAQQLRHLRKQITETAMVWVSWPKKSSGVPTDITEDTIREVALPLGFVDTKVCAVDEVWSGLKLMIRREKRKLAK
jgi:hypothetical protein